MYGNCTDENIMEKNEEGGKRHGMETNMTVTRNKKRENSRLES